ncbi:hypothetical protein [Bacteroides faecalis]
MEKKMRTVKDLRRKQFQLYAWIPTFFLFTFVLMKENIKEGDGLMASNYVRFDWVMKRLLCNKANFGVLEGFFTTLLNGNCDSEIIGE